MAEARKARAVGFNHVALEVGNIEEALAFYGRLFDFELRGKSATSAFIDLGDQFLALQTGRTQPADEGRHLGLVFDDKDQVVTANGCRRSVSGKRVMCALYHRRSFNERD
jgi:lactoylglutathione lyase